MLNWIPRIAATSTLELVAACGGGDDKTVTVVQAAQADARFAILVEAVVAEDLAATLSGPGPFTVFAPTNDAFVDLLTELGVTDQRSRMAGIAQTDILASNGVIHAIDRVILPRHGKPDPLPRPSTLNSPRKSHEKSSLRCRPGHCRRWRSSQGHR